MIKDAINDHFDVNLYNSNLVFFLSSLSSLRYLLPKQALIIPSE